MNLTVTVYYCKLLIINVSGAHGRRSFLTNKITIVLIDLFTLILPQKFPVLQLKLHGYKASVGMESLSVSVFYKRTESRISTTYLSVHKLVKTASYNLSSHVLSLRRPLVSFHPNQENDIERGVWKNKTASTSCLG